MSKLNLICSYLRKKKTKQTSKQIQTNNNKSWTSNAIISNLATGRFFLWVSSFPTVLHISDFSGPWCFQRGRPLMLACCIFNTRAGSLCQGSSVLLRASKTAEQKVSTFAFRATSSSLAHSAGKGSLCGCVELSLRLTCFWLLPKLGKIKKKTNKKQHQG